MIVVIFLFTIYIFSGSFCHYSFCIWPELIVGYFIPILIIVAVIGLEELGKDDQKTFTRAEKLLNFMTQPFHVSEVFTGKKGEYVSIPDNVDGCARIINGDYDHMKKEDFYMIGKAPRI